MSLDRPFMAGGMGPMIPGRIPWRSVRDWAEYHDYTADAFDFLDFCIREMDNEFLAHSARAAAGPGVDNPIEVDEKTARALAKLNKESASGGV
jgi:hypothetical protein